LLSAFGAKAKNAYELGNALARIIGYYIRGRAEIRDDRLTPALLVHNLLDHITFRAKALRHIESISESDRHRILQLYDLEDPLIAPRTQPLRSVLQVISEHYDSRHWHYYEIPQTRVDQSDVVVDCGAGEGLFSLKASGVAKQVYAIEPLPEFVKSLNLTFAQHDNVEVVQCALSNASGTVAMTRQGIHSRIISGESNQVDDRVIVKAKTIDELFLDREFGFSYLKADLEGYEMEMIEGASESIIRYRPKIAITTYHYENDPVAIIRFVKDLVPSYQIRAKGIDYKKGNPVMLHFFDSI
jgi:FkbM family methyltransferase